MNSWKFAWILEWRCSGQVASKSFSRIKCKVTHLGILYKLHTITAIGAPMWKFWVIPIYLYNITSIFWIIWVVLVFSVYYQRNRACERQMNNPFIFSSLTFAVSFAVCRGPGLFQLSEVILLFSVAMVKVVDWGRGGLYQQYKLLAPFWDPFLEEAPGLQLGNPVH